MIRYLYPQGKKKACTFSYDDGQVFDRRLVELFQKYNLKGTFHLNAGTLNEDGFISETEVKALYIEQEVSCHGYTHPYLTHLSLAEIVYEITEERKKLESLVCYPVRGMSYPFGVYSEQVIKVLSGLCMEYSRTVEDTNSFALPGNWMEWHPTCHHNQLTDTLINQFLNPPEYSNLPLLYVWGHSFEFEREKSWVLFEEKCSRLAECNDVWFATNIEIKDYITAVRGLVFSADCKMIFNPYATTVWIKNGNEVIEVEPGNTVTIL